MSKKKTDVIWFRFKFSGGVKTRAAVIRAADRMLRQIPGVHVPAEINRQVRSLFERGIGEYINFYKAAHKPDVTPLIDFGTYMDNYEE